MPLLKYLLISVFFVAGGLAQAKIVAEFTTNRKDAFDQPRKFRVELDPVNAPLAVTHFSLLAGKEDDVWRSGGGAQLPTLPLNPGQNPQGLQFEYETVPGARRNLWLYPVADWDNYPLVKEYVVLADQYGFELGRISPYASAGGIYHDVTGRGRLEMEQDTAFPYNWRIRVKYPRPWFNPATGQPTQETFYQNLPAKSPLGQSLYAGTRVIGGKLVEDPGYSLPDELIKVYQNPGLVYAPTGDPNDDYRKPFSLPYVLAMDNSGPNTNGSGFFITGIANTEWNGRYTAFGTVRSLADRAFVSELISLEAFGGASVVIQSIEVRIEPPYTNVDFFEGYFQNLLPGGYTESVELSIAKVDGKPELRAFSPQEGTEESASLLTRIYSGSDLLEYEFVGSSGIAGGEFEPVKQFVDADLFGGQRGFFDASAWEYPFWPSSDVTMENAIFQFAVDAPGNSAGALTLVFNPEGTGGTFVDTTQVERSQWKDNPDYIPGMGLEPVLTERWMEPEVPTVRNGSFVATYSPSKGPYAATIVIEAVSGELAFDHVELQYSFNPQDHQSALPGALKGPPKPDGYRAYKDEPTTKTEDGWNLVPYEIEGFYYKAQ